MGIKIYDLYPSNDAQFLEEAAAWEMINIKGGFSRRRRNRNPSTVNSSEIATLMQDINTNLDKWRTDIDTTLDDLRQAISF
ncbi:hypothetical protein H6G06_02970 [Anabaena sphaerica FACHB-251]|uniref:Uncharacterized protein n=1 Tax=Anabaena sphaerica FACHB-251 TaxID=2692883 RepID=A0A926WEK9_9NOST|nr:hypothetical protein [Anabaena sphaerica]MBD2292469.1 hypothetical protein [Anabaena sphaerica FACHB-251]